MTKEDTNASEAETSSATQAVTAEYIWEAARVLGLPVAVWRLPETRELKMIVAEKASLLETHPDLEKLSGGFIIAPFHTPDQQIVFLEACLSVSWAPGASIEKISFPGENSNSISEKLFERASELQVSSQGKEMALTNRLIPVEVDGARERFQRIVQLGAEAVKAGKLLKVVLSRTKEFSIDENFSFKHAFLQLESAYPSAFVTMVSLPGSGEVWLGASPEIIVEVKQQRYFRTVALAGTQSAKDANGAIKPKFKVLWSEKEIEEQALVSRYIIECFKRIRLREYLETGPKSSKAGNLYHLKSDFEVDMDSVGFPELGSVMLKLLHPTSAVCGMPKQPALDLIASLEGYDRSFYSGYWGPVNMEHDTNLFVNLRTLRVRGTQMTLFAGAGITGDSVPEDEWQETELKCDTLLSVLAPSLMSEK